MMFISLLLHLSSIPAMAMYLLFAVTAEGWRCCWKRLPLFILLWAGFAVLTLLHVIGHVLDELLFHAYRKTPMNKPVFILGIPRSGTTFLQRLLASDERFTTLTTWEAILAPSITERYLFLALGWLLKPLECGIIFLRRKLFRQMDNIHQIRLQEPEEDFLLLVPVMACLLLAFVCPNASHFWRLGKFDKRLPAWYRHNVMALYRRCLQKQLYFHHGSKASEVFLLSKNPSFTSLTSSLLQSFPEARIIACTRAPAEVIPSQLSALRPAMAILGNGRLSPGTQKKMIGLLYHYYAHLNTTQNNPRMHLQPMSALQSDLETSMASIYAFLALEPSPVLVKTVEEQSGSRKYISSHRYSLAEFYLTENDIEETFRDVWPAQSSANNPLADSKKYWQA